jgi:hypothetical protein
LAEIAITKNAPTHYQTVNAGTDKTAPTFNLRRVRATKAVAVHAYPWPATDETPSLGNGKVFRTRLPTL